MEKVKEQALKILYGKFPPSEYDPVSIHECADEWISKGHVTCFGIVKYYEAYFMGGKPNN